MRSKDLFTATCLVATILFIRDCDAGVMVSLESSTTGSPVLLSAGDTIAFDVVVSGLGEIGNPTSLDFLGVTVDFDPSSFDFLLASFGTIVPSISNGTIAFGLNSAIGQYDAGIPAIDPIAANGIFFSFTLAAKNVATSTDSTVFISDASYFAPDFADADRGGEIHVRVMSGAVVPEPTSFAVFGGGALCLAMVRRRHEF